MATKEPIPLSILEEITNGFSVHSRIGMGGYGNVYKGVYKGTEVAVKLLHVDTVRGLDDQQFKNEVGNHLRVLKHPNIVQLVGYCYETKKIYVEHNGANDFSEHIYRVICFEYLQGGSLDKRLYDQSFAPNWSTRYNIIKGVCEGLNFLHKCEPQILHLDLKPANILLDSFMEPKLADLGLSRLFTQSHTHVTERIIGTQKYMPPECIKDHEISPKNDVFSLGVVMIDIMTGPAGYSNSYEMGDVAQLMQQVLANWRTVIEATSKYPSDENLQVQTCIELAIRCVDPKRDNRPSTTDILDALNKTETNIPKRQRCPRSSVPKLKIAKKRKKTGGHLKGIAKECSRFIVMQENVPSLLEVCDHRETSAKIGAEVVGREMEKQEIMARLSGSTTQEITFLPIYGIGGIGKTTMAQFVFNDSQFKEYSRVWIYVSQTFDLKKIGNSVITQLSGSESKHTNLQMIENSLQNLLSRKRVLIILDDLWERQSSQLKKLESMLNLGEGGKMVVVVTTREESIAQKFHTAIVEPYKLAPLTDDICWTIIKNKSSFENRDERAQLELIGKEIAKKCGGVALAAQSIGYMLDNMNFDEWVSVNNSEIWDVLASGESSTDHVPASLQLSYHRMDPYLKSCFAYCATFQKGHKISKEDLAHQWIALELVEPSKIFSNTQTSQKYISQLLGMCFLEHSRLQSYKEFKKTFLIMHDLVHDLAKSVLADKINIESPACQYAWLTDHRKLFKSSMNPLSKIRALHFLDRGYVHLHAEAFSPAKCLCVLDLSRCCAPELPDSIGQLKQLRYLDASWTHSIRTSREIIFLDGRLKMTREIILIPKALGSLNKLQYLNLSGRARPIGLPEVISKLMELRYLNISSCKGYYSLDSPSANQSFIDCIGTLPNLEQLDMSWNDYVFCVPESFSRLKKLNLGGCKHIASLPENVGKVDIQRLFGLLDQEREGFPVRAVDSESSSSLVWLKHTNPDVLNILDLENVKSVEEARSIKLMGKQRIENLSLDWTGVKILPTWSTWICPRSVEHMDLLTELVPPSSVKNFKIKGYEDAMFPHWFMHISNYLPNLVSLEMSVVRCSSLPTLVQLPNLRKVVLRYMPNLEEFNTACSMGEDGANEHTLAELDYLEIYCCQKLRFKPCPPRAVSWYLHDSDNVLSSWGECASSTAASSSCSPVSKLVVEHSNLPLHQWRLIHHQPCISDLTISCSFPTDGDCFIISPQITRAFTSLESLTLKILDNKFLPKWLGKLTSLRQLNLEHMDFLEELHENMRQLTQLKSLSLKYCDTLTSLPQWLGELSLLTTLKIRSCPGIISLPESILTNLQELLISNCHILYEWCKLEENHMKLAHIKEKVILRSEVEDTFKLTIMDDTVTDEEPPDLYSAVMNMPGFPEEALLVALSHLMDNEAPGSAYMGMQEEQRVSWLMNFLKKNY